jgi:hypothetical protein
MILACGHGEHKCMIGNGMNNEAYRPRLSGDDDDLSAICWFGFSSDLHLSGTDHSYCGMVSTPFGLILGEKREQR